MSRKIKRFKPKDPSKFLNKGTAKSPIWVRKNVQNIYHINTAKYQVVHPLGFTLIGPPALKIGHSDIILAKSIVKFAINQSDEALAYANMVLQTEKKYEETTTPKNSL